MAPCKQEYLSLEKHIRAVGLLKDIAFIGLGYYEGIF